MLSSQITNTKYVKNLMHIVAILLSNISNICSNCSLELAIRNNTQMRELLPSNAVVILQ